jgi:predicted nucleic acid-binding Zn ribbon protein
MPTYGFRDNNTGTEFTEFMTISALDDYLKTNPHLTQLVNGAPMIASGRGMGKPDNGFRDLLKDMKKKHSKGITRSTINTF